MVQERVTSLEVAKLAGVSQSAVSRVFTPGASASAKTVEKVREAAEQLGYRPNAMARAMITGKSRIIGLVVAYLDNQFYPLAMELLSNALQKLGYHILVFTVPNTKGGVSDVIKELLDYQVDGIITASVSVDNVLTQRCAAEGIPIVMFNRAQDSGDLSAVTSANLAGGRKVAQFLVECGYSRIAHISGWEGSSTGRDRRKGFELGLQDSGLIAHQIIDGLYARDAASEAARQLMQHRSPPEAIFVGNDHMAFAVLDTLRYELGLSVPDDVAVVGYDDVPLASWPAFDLTTVRQPINQMVQATIDLLINQIEDSAILPRRVEFDGPLIFRGSAPLRKDAS